MARRAWVFALVCALGARVGRCDEALTLEMRTSDRRAIERDTYLYTAVDIPPGAFHVRRFEPVATQDVVHHMLLYGCARGAKAGLDKVIGGMFTSGARVETCEDGTTQALLFGWGKNAPPLHMPDDAGFRVGEGAFKALVLEVHYLETQSSDSTHESGLDVIISPGKPRLSASVLAWASYFELQPKKEEELVMASCAYDKSRTLRAFSFRVHTHERGTSVWLDRLVGGDSYRAVRLMERDPQLPQEFAALSSSEEFTIQSGDVLRVTCKFNTMNETAPVVAGFGASHEMCNMYIMVFSDEPQYLSCLGSNSTRIGTFTIEAGDAATPVTDLTAVRAYEVKKSWPAMGGVGGVQATNDGSYVWMFHRGSNVWENGEDPSKTMKTIAAKTVVRVDLYTGKVDKSFGANAFVMPHGLRIAPDGSMWLTDTALHQVFHYTADGELIRAFGSRGVKANGARGFCAPADVLILEDGSFAVADGYCNQRIARFDANGEYAGDFDFRGLASDVSVAHQLAYAPSRGEIALANRENATVVLFGASSGVRTQDPIDLSEYGKVYGLTYMASSIEGLRGYYALCWRRDGDGRAHLVRLFWPESSTARALTSTPPNIYAWALPSDITTPHVVAVQSSKNGGTDAWGPGLTVHIASTTSGSSGNYRRFWLGSSDPKSRELGVRTHITDPADPADDADDADDDDVRFRASRPDDAASTARRILTTALAACACAGALLAHRAAHRVRIARIANITAFDELDDATLPLPRAAASAPVGDAADLERATPVAPKPIRGAKAD